MAMAACFVACLLGIIPAIAWARRGAIIADETGLRWRGLGAWKSANWGEVRDYSVGQSQKSSSVTITPAFIETSAGRIKFSSQWTNAKPLQKAIKRHATSAAPQEWEMIGTRPCDPWPRVFGYNTFSNRWSPRLLLKLLLMFVVYVLVKPALGLTGLVALIGWRMTLTTAALYLVLTLPLAIMLLVFPLREYQAVQKRMGQRITLSPDGLIFEDGMRRIDARWEEITGYGIVGTGKYVVETGSGAFDFLGSVANSLLLRENVRQYAVQSADTEWKARVDAEALGGEAARWSSGQVGIGARVFHYQTRSYRMMLGGGLSIFLLGWGLGIATALGWLPGGNPPPPTVSIFGSVLSIALFLYGWRLYWHCGVHLDEDGLTQFTPLWQTRILWTQISDFYLADGSAGTVEGRDGRRIQFSSMIVGREELMAEIARRAAHCGRTVWEKRLSA